MFVLSPNDCCLLPRRAALVFGIAITIAETTLLAHATNQRQKDEKGKEKRTGKGEGKEREKNGKDLLSKQPPCLGGTLSLFPSVSSQDMTFH